MRDRSCFMTYLTNDRAGFTVGQSKHSRELNRLSCSLTYILLLIGLARPLGIVIIILHEVDRAELFPILKCCQYAANIFISEVGVRNNHLALEYDVLVVSWITSLEKHCLWRNINKLGKFVDLKPDLFFMPFKES